MTIKDLRYKDALKLAARMAEDPTAKQIEQAEKTMRKFYRFAAAYSRSFYTEQSRTATQADKERADEQSEKAYKRAADALKVYGLRISCPGLYPIIEEKNGVNFTYGHFYN